MINNIHNKRKTNKRKQHDEVNTFAKQTQKHGAINIPEHNNDIMQTRKLHTKQNVTTNKTNKKRQQTNKYDINKNNNRNINKNNKNNLTIIKYKYYEQIEHNTTNE